MSTDEPMLIDFAQRLGLPIRNTGAWAAIYKSGLAVLEANLTSTASKLAV